MQAQHFDVQIGPARPYEAAAIQTIFRRTWLATYPNAEHGITKEDIEVRFRQKESRLVSALRQKIEYDKRVGDTLLVVRCEQEVIAVSRTVNTQECNELRCLYVLPQYHNVGIGAALWRCAHRELDHARDVTVWVVSYNDRAIRFYERCGFRKTGEERKDARLAMPNGAILPTLRMVKPAA